MNALQRGLVSGAVGTVAINLATYLDMLLRGRPPSTVPSQVAGKLAEKTGITALAASNEDERAQNRRSAAGALFGYANGIGCGVAYGLLRPLIRTAPAPLAGCVLGGVSMAISDVSSAQLGVTDPATWGAASWLGDILPHVVYGLTIAYLYEGLL